MARGLGKAGLSLMEVIVSMVIITLTMMGLANLFIAGRRHLQHSKMRMTGSELSKRFIDPLMMQVRQDQWGSNCLSGGTGCPSSFTFEGNQTFTAAYTISDVTPTLKRVTVNLRWNETAP